MAAKDKFEILERKLNIATELIDELNIEEYEIVAPDYNTSTELVAVDTTNTELVTVDKQEVFTIEGLKQDFILIRQNVMKLITTGQRILDSASLLDVADMKAAQLNALSSLQETLGNNLKLLVNIYKEICEIEKMRLGVSGKVPDGSVQQLNTGTITNNNTIVFSGDTSQLLDIIKQNQIT